MGNKNILPRLASTTCPFKEGNNVVVWGSAFFQHTQAMAFHAWKMHAHNHLKSEDFLFTEMTTSC